MHICVCIPAYDGKIPTELASSLVGVAFALSQRNDIFELQFLNNCSLVQKARNNMVKLFLKSEADVLFFIDSDISFETKEFLRIVHHMKSHPIVAGAYVIKDESRKVHFDYFVEDNKPKISEDGLVHTKSVGAGFMCIRRDALETMLQKFPDLSYTSDDDYFRGEQIPCLFDAKLVDGKYYGEDVLFCKRAREAGLDVLVDPVMRLKHHGTKIYSL